MEKKTVELKDLVGVHSLMSVSNDLQNLSHPYFDDETYDATVCIFTLDGITYMAQEDNNDGYRSSMREITIVNPIKIAQFRNDVFGIYRDKSGSYNDADIIDFYDLKTAKLVLSVGTDNSDDYYPRFVSSFQPENMAINIQ